MNTNNIWNTDIMPKSQKYFEKPVYYLQRNDFDDNGNLIVPELRNKKVIIMIQANYCGHCTQMLKEIIIKQQST